MFQTLLEDRFKLRVHWETRGLAGYDLVISKSGSKLKPANPDSKILIDSRPIALGTGGVFFRAGGARLIGKGASIEQLVSALIGRVRAPIPDHTGLTGTFDCDVAFLPTESKEDVSSAPILAIAIPEELGLKLEKSKVPVQVLVIEHFERPTAN
jgi:uncharacterized protein (TIGR03435 family)